MRFFGLLLVLLASCVFAQNKTRTDRVTWWQVVQVDTGDVTISSALQSNTCIMSDRGGDIRFEYIQEGGARDTIAMYLPAGIPLPYGNITRVFQYKEAGTTDVTDCVSLDRGGHEFIGVKIGRQGKL